MKVEAQGPIRRRSSEFSSFLSVVEKSTNGAPLISPPLQASTSFSLHVGSGLIARATLKTKKGRGHLIVDWPWRPRNLFLQLH